MNKLGTCSTVYFYHWKLSKYKLQLVQKKKLNTRLKLLEYSSPKTAEMNCKYIFVILCEGTIKYSRAKLIHYKQVFYNQNHMLVEEKTVSKIAPFSVLRH